MNEPWYENNNVELLINGDEFFPKVFSAIENAKHEVLLETFIFNEDEVGIELQHVLIAAAQRGVRVEVTVDDYGSADLTEAFIASMTEVGIHLHVFDPKPRLLGARLNLFRRLHRKIVVVDASVAFVGGINYCADHLTTFGPLAKQDYAVQVRGPVVEQIHQACWQLLRYGQCKSTTQFPMSEEKKAAGTVGGMRTQFYIRDNIHHKKDIEQQYLRAIQGAKYRITIANAYFFPGYKLLRAIRRAARRGVTVTLILQGQPDLPWVSACTRLLYEYLLRSGVVIYEYHQRPLHAKVALVDDDWSTVGSSNLDPLSLALNLEANLIIKSKTFNQQLHKELRSLATAHSTPVNLSHARRGYWWRLIFVSLSFHFLRVFPAIAGWFPLHSPKLPLLTANSDIKTNEADEVKSAEVEDITGVKNSAEVKDIKPKHKQRDAEEMC